MISFRCVVFLLLSVLLTACGGRRFRAEVPSAAIFCATKDWSTLEGQLRWLNLCVDDSRGGADAAVASVAAGRVERPQPSILIVIPVR